MESQKQIALYPTGDKHNISMTTQFNAQLSAFETEIDHDDGVCGQELLVAAATFLNHISMVYREALATAFKGNHPDKPELEQAALNIAKLTGEISGVLSTAAGSETKHVNIEALKDRLM